MKTRRWLSCPHSNSSMIPKPAGTQDILWWTDCNCTVRCIVTIRHVAHLIFKDQQVVWWFFDLPGHQDLTTWKLTEVDWIVLEDLEMVLKVCFTCPKGLFATNLFMIYPRFHIVHSMLCPASTPHYLVVQFLHLKCSLFNGMNWAGWFLGVLPLLVLASDVSRNITSAWEKPVHTSSLCVGWSDSTEI